MSAWRHAGLMLSAAALLACACTRDAPPPSAPAPSAPASAPSAASEPAAAPAAESGLAIKRGVMTLARDRTTFRPCDEPVDLWVFDQTDGVLSEAFAQSAPSNAPVLLYVEAYGERTAVTDDIPQARGYAGLLVLEEVLYAGAQSETVGCAAPPPQYIVIARGNEPFWSAEVREAHILWRQADAPRELTLGAPQTEDAEGVVRYRAAAADHEVEVLIESQPCRDSMSGEFFAFSARAALDGREFKGCARVGK